MRAPSRELGERGPAHQLRQYGVKSKTIRIGNSTIKGYARTRPILGQSLLMSLVEAITNVVVGFLLALLTQIVIFPMFGLKVSVADNLLIGGVFTAVSIVRSFALRRLFEALPTH